MEYGQSPLMIPSWKVFGRFQWRIGTIGGHALLNQIDQVKIELNKQTLKMINFWLTSPQNFYNEKGDRPHVISMTVRLK
ncbi:MAG: hypothetical protein HWN65_14655 [Candidatus Helarchaeota archaeon]|nr:hypothetical protein [Candidatus Helarchaeota archaeon]